MQDNCRTHNYHAHCGTQACNGLQKMVLWCGCECSEKKRTQRFSSESFRKNYSRLHTPFTPNMPPIKTAIKKIAEQVRLYLEDLAEVFSTTCASPLPQALNHRMTVAPNNRSFSPDKAIQLAWEVVFTANPTFAGGHI